MRNLDEYAWKAVQPCDAADRLIKYLISLGYLEEGNTTYTSALTDQLPIAYFAVCGYFEEDEVITRLAAELNLGTATILLEDREELLAFLAQEPSNRIEPLDLRHYCVLPIGVSDDSLQLAMANPLDYEAIKRIEFTLGMSVQPLLACEDEINGVLDTKLSLSDKDAIDFIVKDIKQPLELKNSSGNARMYESSAEHDDASAAPVVRLVNKIFSQSIHCGASDLHIIPQKDYLAVKVRVDGIMRPLFEIPNELRDSVISRIKLLCGMDLAEKRLPQDGRLRFKTAHGVRDTRISTVPASYGENLVARILSSSLAGVTFETLIKDTKIRERYIGTLKQASRVHLVTGPTGSGKTTTLYTSLLRMIDGETNIITLEDPIEYRIDGITQIQINSKLQLNFAQGLRSILRQDPDVVLVGEIRDEETASISMKVAQTGHVVLSTLHTNSAAAAITRLRDLGVPSYLIASSLGSVMAQRLVRRLCEECSQACSDELARLCERAGLDPTAVKERSGCEKCCNTGYVGRVGIYSLLDINEYVREAIRDEASENEIGERATENGFKTLMENARWLISAGETSVEEVERVLGPLVVDEEVCKVPVSSKTSYNTPNGAPDQSERNGKPRVLVVEDDSDSADVIGAILTKAVFAVDTAGEGSEALEKLYEGSYDLIISDVMMPRMSGFELLQRLKSEKQLRDIPVLMLTASATEESELKLMRSGADDFVSKTTRPDIIIERARRLLR